MAEIVKSNKFEVFMELVCVTTGMSVEEMKSFRRLIGQLGFKCQIRTNGWVYFSLRTRCNLKLEHIALSGSPNSEEVHVNTQWKRLQELILKESSLVMLYFILDNGSRVTSLDYIANCRENKKDNLSVIFLQGLKGFIKISIKQRVNYLLNMKAISRGTDSS